MWPLRWFHYDDGIDSPEVYLLDGAGRMSAWCPDTQVSYNVSLAEMGQMSQEARYYVTGFLAGNQPEPPPLSDLDAEIDPGDLTAWKAAAARFRRTGLWLGRWRTCQACGRALLPDTAADNCQEHRQSQPS